MSILFIAQHIKKNPQKYKKKEKKKEYISTNMTILKTIANIHII